MGRRTTYHLHPRQEDDTQQNLPFEAEIRLEDEAIGEEKSLGNRTKTKASLHNYENSALRRVAAAKGVKISIPLEDAMIIAVMAFQILLALFVASVAYYGLTEVSTVESVLQESTRGKSFTEKFLTMLAILFRVYN
jgi:hypothetical protein